MVDNGEDKPPLPSCNSRKQFSSFTKYLTPHFENGMKLFTQNCRHMTLTFDMAQEDISFQKGNLGFVMNYGPENYKHFTNFRSFSILDMWSQIGGFVGMLLGYSLLQAPDILHNVYLTSKSYVSKRLKKWNKRMVKDRTKERKSRTEVMVSGI